MSVPLTVVINIGVTGVSYSVLVVVLLIHVGDGRAVVTRIPLLVGTIRVAVRLVGIRYQRAVVLEKVGED